MDFLAKLWERDLLGISVIFTKIYLLIPHVLKKSFFKNTFRVFVIILF